MSKVYDNVISLDGIKAVRKRPGMYVGSVRSNDGKNPQGLLQLAQEIISNSSDEGLSGHGDKIFITIHKDNSLTVKDFGRGLPMGKNFDSAIRSFTVLHTSGKFDSSIYKNAGGLHGIGAKATNALSKWLSVEAVTSVGDKYKMKFEQAEVVSKESSKASPKDITGTTVTFLPDDSIFSSICWDYSALYEIINNQAYVCTSVQYILSDERDDSVEPVTLFHPNGMKDFVDSYCTEAKKPFFTTSFRVFDSVSPFDMDFSLNYVESQEDILESFVNAIPTINGGTHVNAATLALLKAFNDFLMDMQTLDSSLFKNVSKFVSNDIKEGMIAGLSVGIPEEMLDFEGQTKGKLGTVQIVPFITSTIYDSLMSYLSDNHDIGIRLLERFVDVKESRESLQMLKEKKRLNRLSKKQGTDPFTIVSGKLTDCSCKDPEKCDIFIVEGDSAGGSAKKARDPKTQAILPLKGKPLNIASLDITNAKDIKTIVDNEEVSTLTKALGCGIGKDYDESKLRYDKIIAMADADDDGAHICILLFCMLWVLFRPLILNGHFYVANAPLFRLQKYGRGGKREIKFIQTKEEFEIFHQSNNFNTWEAQRMKGLGEMNPEDLWTTTMNPKTRSLDRIVVTDIEKTDYYVQLFLGSMKVDGKSPADRRRNWIVDNVEFDITEDTDGLRDDI